MRRPLRFATILLMSGVVAGCGGGQSGSDATDATGVSSVPFSISAEGFDRGETMPIGLTCDGADRSPRLFWTAIPDGTRELALIVDDPDAGGFVHWVAYNTPGTAREFAADQAEGNLVTFGTNDVGRTGWAGPCPPPGSAHQYDFTLYALGEPLGLAAGATAQELRSAMEGTILDEACISAFYERRGG